MKKQLLIIITRGHEDEGMHATLGFVLGLNALTFGHDVTIFLTGEGVIWGYKGEADQINTRFFPPLVQIIHNFISKEGRVIICSSCSRACPTGVEFVEGSISGGLASVVPVIMSGQVLTF